MLILTRGHIAGLLTFGEYVEAVETCFRAHAEGRSLHPALMHVDAPEGEFHVKGGGLLDPEPVFALKSNGSFFHNRARHGLPNIQGAIILASAETGTPLALMDSVEITMQRTGAATAVAARYLARPEASVATVCGCGNQGRIQLRAVCHALPIRRAFAYSPDRPNADAARAFAAAMSAELGIAVDAAPDLWAALAESDVVVTATPARRAFIAAGDVRQGTFIAAVGADSPGKQELDARLTASASVFGDLLAQCIKVGEFQHPVSLGLARAEDFRGELGEVIVGRRPGRTSADEITIYDSTGTALQDAAAAAAVYRKATAAGIGTIIELAR